MTIEVPARALALVIHELLRRGVPDSETYGSSRTSDVRDAIVLLSCKLQLHWDAMNAALPDLSHPTPKES